MTAIPHTAALVAPLSAMNPVVVSIPLAPQKLALNDQLSISETETGLIIYKSGNPVCWIMPGYHEGQSDNFPKRCDFVDVAYHRQTQRGVNLETRDFLSLPDALEFVAEIFGDES